MKAKDLFKERASLGDCLRMAVAAAESSLRAKQEAAAKKLWEDIQRELMVKARRRARKLVVAVPENLAEKFLDWATDEDVGIQLSSKQPDDKHIIVYVDEETPSYITFTW